MTESFQEQAVRAQLGARDAFTISTLVTVVLTALTGVVTGTLRRTDNARALPEHPR